MSSHSSESEGGEEETVVEESRPAEKIEDTMKGGDGGESQTAEGRSRILELLQEERENNSKDEVRNNGTMSQGYRKIQQAAEDVSENSSVTTPRAPAHMGSPDGSVVSFQDDTPSVQVGFPVKCVDKC